MIHTITHEGEIRPMSDKKNEGTEPTQPQVTGPTVNVVAEETKQRLHQIFGGAEHTKETQERQDEIFNRTKPSS